MTYLCAGRAQLERAIGSNSREYHAIIHARGGGTRSSRLRRIGLPVAILLRRRPAAVALRGWHGQDAPQYQTVAAESGDIIVRVSASGTLSAVVTVDVGSQVSGRIQSLYADFNSIVKKGQRVAKIDPALFEAAVAQSAANVSAARGNLQRLQVQAEDAARQARRSSQLFESRLVSENDRDNAVATARAAAASVAQAQGQLEQALAALRQAQTNLRYTDILAPTDGIVISRSVNVGQTVAASLQAPVLFTIAQDLRAMEVHTNVAESDIGRLRAGMPASFTVDAYPGERFRARIREIRNAPQVVQNVVTYDAVIDVANEDLRLKPGMTATVTVIADRRDGVLRVPNAALRFRPEAAAGEGLAAAGAAGRAGGAAAGNGAACMRRDAAAGENGDERGGASLQAASCGCSRAASLCGAKSRSAWRIHRTPRSAAVRSRPARPSSPVSPRRPAARPADGPACAAASGSSEAAMALIELRGVTKLYRSGEADFAALRDVDLVIDSGEFVAVTGSSGSGKSTLMNILGCLDSPTRGSYRLADRDVAGLSRIELAIVRNRFIGFVFQSFNLLARTSALENVELPLIYAGVAPAERRRRALESLERVGLAQRSAHQPSQLSGGQQQRVAIARALVTQPPLILADEPTGNLDSVTSVEIMKLLAGLRAAGITIVYVTHEPDIAAFAGRRLVLRDGVIVQDERQQAGARAAVASAPGAIA
ncbi:MAG: efflux RND transporter periplasmic adaptor subunit [Steroidobacteraceae bacterium]